MGYIGEASEVTQKRICDDELILVTGTKARTAASIILRGPNDFYCDEMERSVHDSLCVVKRVMESKNIVVGGGTVEAALSIYLENFATTLSSREQLAIADFAKSLLVIPKTLAVKAAHSQMKNFGLDLYEGAVRDNSKAGVPGAAPRSRAREPLRRHDPASPRSPPEAAPRSRAPEPRPGAA